MDHRKLWRDYLENILVAVFLALVVRTFILTGYKVPTSSMSPTLRSGDFIFSYKIPYGIKIPLTNKKIGAAPVNRGDIVVFTYPEQPQTHYVKRVIGIAGDIVKIDGDIVHVNGIKLKYEALPANEILEIPSHDLQTVQLEIAPEGSRKIITLKDQKRKIYGPIVVPPGEVFLLGDNRDASDDSRYWGTVPSSRIEGRVVLIWLSIDWKSSQIRWQRLFTKPQ